MRSQSIDLLCIYMRASLALNPLSANPTKWPNILKTIRRRIADELFECVWLFCEIGKKKVNELIY